jgi:hypothetical protein
MASKGEKEVVMRFLQSFIAGFLLLVLGGLTAVASEDISLAVSAKNRLEELNHALLAGDFVKAVDLTYPKVVADAGGRERMIAIFQSAMQRMKAKGYVIEAIELDAPGDFVPSGDNLMVVVPFTAKMTTPQGKLSKRSFVIGISADKGQTWTFANGDLDPARLKRLLPDLPTALKLPERQKAVREETQQAQPGTEPLHEHEQARPPRQGDLTSAVE